MVRILPYMLTPTAKIAVSAKRMTKTYSYADGVSDQDGPEHASERTSADYRREFTSMI